MRFSSSGMIPQVLTLVHLLKLTGHLTSTSLQAKAQVLSLPQSQHCGGFCRVDEYNGDFFPVLQLITGIQYDADGTGPGTAVDFPAFNPTGGSAAIRTALGESFWRANVELEGGFVRVDGDGTISLQEVDTELDSHVLRLYDPSESYAVGDKVFFEIPANSFRSDSSGFSPTQPPVAARGIFEALVAVPAMADGSNQPVIQRGTTAGENHVHPSWGFARESSPLEFSVDHQYAAGVDVFRILGNDINHFTLNERVLAFRTPRMVTRINDPFDDNGTPDNTRLERPEVQTLGNPKTVNAPYILTSEDLSVNENLEIGHLFSASSAEPATSWAATERYHRGALVFFDNTLYRLRGDFLNEDANGVDLGKVSSVTPERDRDWVVIGTQADPIVFHEDVPATIAELDTTTDYRWAISNSWRTS